MKIVVFGGGTGLSVLLRGLKHYTKDISAIVTVADNGGGSGVLREDLGMLPPGDMRNCIIALADIEPIMLKLMQHRFKDGYLNGQSFGNLFIAAMYEIFGDYEHALKEIGSIFRLSGKVLPMTLQDTQLKAYLSNGECIVGEKDIPEFATKTDSKIDKVSLVPDICMPLDETVRDIQEADVIIIGPGSLYTSVMPNLLVKSIPDMITNSKATVFYVCNLMTQPGETDNYNVLDHVNAIIKHSNRHIIDYVIANDELIPEEQIENYKYKGSAQVIIDKEQIKTLEEMNIRVISSNFIEIRKNYIRHNSGKIGQLLLNYINEKNNQQRK
ncbi:uridine diphosphate-N-acetylglucosamine-binding protein YvcK [Sedimentibacter hydroxybenzoicus DSM 7310]|uniref:Putative gluconeogenesis factor n=1 Tax=Sedimentibacter hydroxybenzoicus DSM 7310 TaxID=1123245 RepID=A0A974GVS1_SEDHY|nr:uridine diphosphate-N-acetylglucosamine-binding protein YvcK [Sedimentibacter hydroxybenzoicus]NYB73702.1 uridine diphosphate-N-acetylglucosamine-binding protein YvcK [Sedimentibacter hydroxybenzoicus DSM 7310]